MNELLNVEFRLTVCALIFFCAWFFAAASGCLAAAKPETLSDALEGRRVLRVSSMGPFVKTVAVAGEFKDFDAVVVDGVARGDFSRFMSENKKTLLEFCAGAHFGALLLELPAAECKKLDCFVISGEEDPRDAVRGSVFDAQPFLEFVENLRVINCEAKNAHKKIRIKSVYCGLDEEEAARALRFVKQAVPAAAEGLARFIRHLKEDDFVKLNESQRARLIRDGRNAALAVAAKAPAAKSGFLGEEFVKCSLRLDILNSIADYYEKRLRFDNGTANTDALEKIKTGVVLKSIRYYAENDFYGKCIMVFNKSLIK